MEILRLIRNIAVLFILVVALFASRPGVGVSHAGQKVCFFKIGYNCSINSNGNCAESRCTGLYCQDTGCTLFKKGGF
jgi:hypothetical protein